MFFRRAIVYLAFNGGYVDTLGFLSFNGLFTAHVTGNFVTLGAALAHGYTGIITKLLALPVFCLTIVVSRFCGKKLSSAGKNDLRVLLLVKIALMCIAAFIVCSFGPFAEGDSPGAMTAGLILVAAMAIQNAVHRSHLTKLSPSTLMTGTTTQLILDLTDIFTEKSNDAKASLINRIKKSGCSLLFFTLGCVTAAAAYIFFKRWGFMLPPVIALAAWIAIEKTPASQQQA